MREISKLGLRTVGMVMAVGLALAPRVSLAQDNAPSQAPSHDNYPSTQPSNPSDQPPPMQGQATPDVSASQTTNGTLTLTKIDKTKRMLSLTDDQGQVHDVKAGPDISLDKLKVGQKVDVTYYQEVALAIQKAGQPAPRISQSQLQRGGVTAQQTTVTGKIIAVDDVGHTVTVQGPTGKHMIQVSDPQLQGQLSQIKPGQNMQVTYTQALAVSAEPSMK